MAENNFQYALVARGTTPLAEHSISSANHRLLVLKMLESLDPKKTRGIVEQATGIVLSLTEPDRMTFVCVVNRQISSAAGYSFLDELKGAWRKRYGNSGSNFAPNSKNEEFRSEIDALFRNYNSQSYQKLNQIKANLDAAQSQMTQNLTMALARGEQLSNMETKAEDIRASAQTFKREAKELKCQQLCARIRWWILGIVIVLVVIVVILLVACGVKFQKCGGASDDTPSPTVPPTPDSGG
jgi:tetrahydromethanopterin S-methyltransferase subunit F